MLCLTSGTNHLGLQGSTIFLLTRPDPLLHVYDTSAWSGFTRLHCFLLNQAWSTFACLHFIGLVCLCKATLLTYSLGLTCFCNTYEMSACSSFAILHNFLPPPACPNLTVFLSLRPVLVLQLRLAQFCGRQPAPARPTFTGKCTCPMTHFCVGDWLNHLAVLLCQR